MSRVAFTLLGCWFTLSGCAGKAAEPPPAAADSPPDAASPAKPAAAANDATGPAQATAAAAPAAAGSATTREVPNSCADASNCAPPTSFVDAVCKKKFPNLPLYMFAGKMPWQHLYVKAEYVEPVNPHGGDQSEAWMKFGEEVIVLRRSAPGGAKGVQVSGPSDLDVLRWDGTCATIRAEMLVSYVPAPMQSPRIIWKYLDSDLQEALLKNQVVAHARDVEKKNCKDSSATHPTEPCDKAMQKLTDAIALAVHTNVELPATAALPDWVK